MVSRYKIAHLLAVEFAGNALNSNVAQISFGGGRRYIRHSQNERASRRYARSMVNIVSKPSIRDGHVTGSFLDHESGGSFEYIAEFQEKSDDIFWNGRVQLARHIWHSVRGGQLSATDPVGMRDADVSEPVRDALLSELVEIDFSTALRSARLQSRKLIARQIFLGVGMAAIMLSAAVWLWIGQPLGV